MRHIWGLVLLFLFTTEACKQKAKILESDSYDDDEDRILPSPPSEDKVPGGEKLIPNIEDRTFLVKMKWTCTGTTRYSTGTRILPYVVAAHKLSRGCTFEKITYTADNGKLITKDAILIACISWFCLVRISVSAEETTKVKMNSVPITTRTDVFQSTNCSIWAIDDNGYHRYKVALSNWTESTNKNYTIYFFDKESTRKHFNPLGSPVICDDRLAGIKYDGEDCCSPGDIIGVIRVRTFDWWILNQIRPTGYFNYTVILDNPRSSAGSFSVSQLILYTALFLYLNRINRNF